MPWIFILSHMIILCTSTWNICFLQKIWESRVNTNLCCPIYKQRNFVSSPYCSNFPLCQASSTSKKTKQIITHGLQKLRCRRQLRKLSVERTRFESLAACAVEQNISQDGTNGGRLVADISVTNNRNIIAMETIARNTIVFLISIFYYHCSHYQRHICKHISSSLIGERGLSRQRHKLQFCMGKT